MEMPEFCLKFLKIKVEEKAHAFETDGTKIRISKHILFMDDANKGILWECCYLHFQPY